MQSYEALPPATPLYVNGSLRGQVDCLLATAHAMADAHPDALKILKIAALALLENDHAVRRMRLDQRLSRELSTHQDLIEESFNRPAPRVRRSNGLASV